ncbi:MAG: hypothetical protein A2W35_04810 [Chloroflexi bacterium RBG_16_57_11]|nr:MAG: hypothetical protein A2W35_04810 [Chloroflexi bacterium RBG_16_57_11]
MEKKYSIQWQGDEVVSFEVDGVQYESLDEVPDEADREKLLGLMAGTREIELGTPARPSINLGLIVLTVFIGVAALMCVISVLTGVSTWRGMSREVEAPGQVVEMVTRKDEQGNEFYYPVVAFSLADGSRQTVQMAEGSWPPSFAVGDEVKVLYDPGKPLEARVKSTSGTVSLWIWTMVTGVLAVAFVLATLLAWWVLKEVPDTPEMPDDFAKDFKEK